MLLRCREEDNRSLREAIEELIDDGHVIGSSSKPGGGYYWITSESELRRATETLRSRARALERKAAALEDGYRRGASQPALLG